MAQVVRFRKVFKLKLLDVERSTEAPTCFWVVKVKHILTLYTVLILITMELRKGFMC